MKFSKMKIECPVCQSRIKEVRRDDKSYWTECPNQCTRIRYTLRGEMTSYIIRVHIDDKDYQFVSQRASLGIMPNENKFSVLNIYKYIPDTEKWGFKEIMQFSKFTDFEEVANNPSRFVQRLLNVKVFA